MSIEDINGIKFTKGASQGKFSSVVGSELGETIEKNFKTIANFLNFDIIGDKLVLNKSVDIPGVNNISAALGALLFNQALIGFTAVKLDAVSFKNFGDTLEYDFKDALQIDAINSQNYLHNIPGDEIQAIIGGLVPQGAGTVEGNMTLGGSLPASFNGLKLETAPNSSKSASTNGNIDTYVGKSWGAGQGRIISQVEIWPADTGFGLGAGKSAILKLWGSTAQTSTGGGTKPSGTVVELGSITFSSGLQLTQKLITATDTSTAYEYHWVSMQHNGGFAINVFSEVEFTEVVTTPVIVQSTSAVFNNTPNTIKGTLFLTEGVSLTENVDIILEVSRDGGTTFNTVDLQLKGAPVLGVGKILSGDADVSAQPFGKNIVWKLTAPNLKPFDIEGVAIQGQ